MTPFTIRRTVEWTRSSLWVPAAVSVTAAGTAAAYLTGGDSAQDGWRYAFGYRGSVSDANDVLIGELTALVTTMTIAFSMMLVALQVASAQFSPRLVRRWVRDSNTKVTLSVFLATISFALATLLGISGRSGDAPAVAITVSMVLVLASAVTAVAYFHHIAQSMRIENVMQEITRRGLRAIGARTDLVVASRGTAGTVEGSLRRVVPIRAQRSGYLRGVTASHGARRTIETSGAHVDVLRCRGDWIAAGEEYATVSSTVDLSDGSLVTIAAAVGELVDLAEDRPFDIELDLAVRLLVDIAIKAISPAVNDPYTAVQAVQHLRTLVLHLARHDVAEPTTGRPLVRVPVPSFDDRLALACEQVIRSSDRSPTVLEAVLELLSSVARLDVAGAVGGPDSRRIDELRSMVAEVASQMSIVQDRRRLTELLDAFPDLPAERARLL